MFQNRLAAFLVVEDDLAYARALGRVLGTWGNVTTASGAEAALREMGDTAFDAIVADIGLPDGSGLDVIEAASSRHGKTVALAVSGDVDADMMRRIRALGVAFVLKPMSSRVIEAFARRAIPIAKQLAAVLNQWGRHYGLSEAEQDGLLAFAAEAGADLSDELLRKLGHNSQESVVASLLWTVAAAAARREEDALDIACRWAEERRDITAENGLVEKALARASQHGLSAHESDLLVFVVSGFSRKEYLRIRNISENTCKKRAQSAVRKLGVLSLGEVRDELLQETVGRQAVERPPR